MQPFNSTCSCSCFFSSSLLFVFAGGPSPLPCPAKGLVSGWCWCWPCSCCYALACRLVWIQSRASCQAVLHCTVYPDPSANLKQAADCFLPECSQLTHGGRALHHLVGTRPVVTVGAPGWIHLNFWPCFTTPAPAPARPTDRPPTNIPARLMLFCCTLLHVFELFSVQLFHDTSPSSSPPLSLPLPRLLVWSILSCTLYSQTARIVRRSILPPSVPQVCLSLPLIFSFDLYHSVNNAPGRHVELRWSSQTGCVQFATAPGRGRVSLGRLFGLTQRESLV